MHALHFVDMMVKGTIPGPSTFSYVKDGKTHFIDFIDADISHIRRTVFELTGEMWPGFKISVRDDGQAPHPADDAANEIFYNQCDDHGQFINYSEQDAYIDLYPATWDDVFAMT